MTKTETKLCAGCRRRAYCSRVCQRRDWKTAGQKHKFWCKLECGEEDLDWAVTHVPGRGLGLQAKHDLPVGFRILVDAEYDRADGHNGISDLMPNDGDLKAKFDLNCLSVGGRDGSVVCVRLSRANHDCFPNACHYSDNELGVKVLFAVRPISAGDEICIDYVAWNDPATPMDPMMRQNILKTKWGIECDYMCVCMHPTLTKLVSDAAELDKQIDDYTARCEPRRALSCVRELFKIHDAIASNKITRCRTHYNAFQASVMTRSTHRSAKEHI
ncbi:unnamed protein product, partial [Heterosigma akashiwo]